MRAISCLMLRLEVGAAGYRSSIRHVPPREGHESTVAADPVRVRWLLCVPENCRKPGPDHTSLSRPRAFRHYRLWCEGLPLLGWGTALLPGHGWQDPYGGST